ncbi:MAG TPA: amidohydrolase family protein, partial [Candidatus Limnocylindria bacterium]|nr:amidohydrolase family protein [Candidatus Limnocylindria bacterium]
MCPGNHWLVRILSPLGFVLSLSVSATELTPPGFRPLPPGVHALVGARVVPSPGTVFSNATVVIRDGLIAAVGPQTDISPPPEARIWDASGMTIYPGLIDPYLAVGGKDSAKGGEEEGLRGSAPFTAAGHRFYGVAGQERDPGSPGPGYEIPGITPERRIAAGFNPDVKEFESLREIGFTAGNLVPGKGIIRGQSAFSVFGDGSPNEMLLRADVAQHVALVGASGESYPRSLMGIIAAIRQTYFDAGHYALDQTAYVAQPASRKRPSFNAALAALQSNLGSSKQPVVFEPGSALMVARAAQMARELGVDFQIVASGQEWRRPELAAATKAPFIVPLGFPALPKYSDEDAWENVSLDQLRVWDWAPENPGLLKAQGLQIALTTYGLGDKKEFRQQLRAAIDRGLSETDALAALTTVPAQLCGVADRLGTIAPGKIANLTITDSKGYFDPEGKVKAVWVDGRVYEFAADKKSGKGDTAKAESGSEEKSSAEKDKDKEKDKEKADKKKNEMRELAKKRVARSPLAGRGIITNPPALLIRHAVVWTAGAAGTVTNADLLISGGHISAVGSVPADKVDNVAGLLVIDGGGKLHVTAGIIDCHSHSMILGGVNETGLPSTAMVRIGDVVNSEASTIHEQLAGGVTAVSLLHGSANPIGGQNQVIKLRDTASPEDLKFTNAPPGIKFALGENVKQSNWGDRYTTRFPQSRMGVGTFYNNRFTAARQYLDEWKAWHDGGDKGVPPRRDLELEALGEIIEGQRLIHCHSYRQDEILNFLRTMESFGVKVGTLQHILEGYKVADEIAKHGAGASTFADWWAYKYEVIDSIAYGASLMRERGVVVSINSDSSDHARRLNFEAAKSVKYGNTSEEEAMKFVTLNPAKQLHIDTWVGSLEVGKDADFVIWSGDPLDSRSVCLETWIEGKKYFDRT